MTESNQHTILLRYGLNDNGKKFIVQALAKEAGCLQLKHFKFSLILAGKVKIPYPKNIGLGLKFVQLQTP